jgi:hypothetical protein
MKCAAAVPDGLPKSGAKFALGPESERLDPK